MVPTSNDPIVGVEIDPELAREAVTYYTESGKEGSVHLDAFLDYNRDPRLMEQLTKYKLTLIVLDMIRAIGTPKAEIQRRLGTSPSQLERLLDPGNRAKSIDSMLRLVAALGGEISVSVKGRGSSRGKTEKVLTFKFAA